MGNIVEMYGSIPIYKDKDDDYFYYILCCDRNGDIHRIFSAHISALKRKITQAIKYDNLKWNGEYVYVYF